MINKKLFLLCVGLIMTTQMIFSQVPSYVPSSGLVGYWGFNGNANDESGNSNNGTVNGATLTTDRFGNNNNAFSFDGVNDLIKINHSSSFNIFPMSISLWCKGNSQYGALISKYTSCSSNNGWQLHTMEGKVSTYSYNFLGGAYLNCDGDANTIISDNNWYNIVSTYDLSGVKIYVNNVLVLTKPYIGNGSMSAPTNIQDVYIGTEINSISCSPYNTFYQGKIDDIGIWNRALSQQEITNMYNGVNYSDTCNAVSGSLVNGLVAYYPFCGNANDQSGNDLNGTVNGATLTTDRFGNNNNAYNFNGTSDFIKVLDNDLLDLTQNLTLSAWISPNSVVNEQAVFGKGKISSQTGYSLLHNVLIPEKTGISIQNAPIPASQAHINSSTLNLNTWYQLVGTYNGSELKLYLNGVLFNTVSTSLQLMPNSLTDLFIGCELSGFRFFNGKIDDIGIWNRALTQQEITQLYNQNQCITNITVTDTLIINVGQLSYTNPIAYSNNITIAPNPASTQININFNNISDLNGGSIKIINSLGQQVATTPITTSGTNTTMSLDTWGGTGLYFVQILNAQGQILDIKKIILQ